jgi:TRAP-type mannitol/chloroaromatic compound transport system permease large subunit
MSMILDAIGIIFVPFLVLMFMGVPVGFVFIVIMMGASLLIVGPSGGSMTVMGTFSSIATFSLAPVPLFVMMGEALLHTGLATRAMDAVGKLLGKVPARLAILSNLGGALFGMLSGSTMASCAMLGSTLGPEMIKRNYSKKMTYGPILASGGLAMIIPPALWR